MFLFWGNDSLELAEANALAKAHADENVELRKDIEDLQVALSKFGSHSYWCNSILKPIADGRVYNYPTDSIEWAKSHPCSCGFAAALKIGNGRIL